MNEPEPVLLPDPDGRRRLLAALRPHVSRAQLVVAVLLAMLGFGLVTQVQSNRAAGLATLRQDDLVRVLDDVTQRENRLRQEEYDLRQTRDQLVNGSDSRQAAVEEARKRIDTLGILAGTVPATGPGIELTIHDPDTTVGGDVLLNAVQELRDAGAEVMAVNGVRLVASSWFSGPPGAVVVDGHPVAQPYVLTAIGDSSTLKAALDFAGGVLRGLPQNHPGASGTVRELPTVTITATVPASRPTFGTPVPQGTPTP